MTDPENDPTHLPAVPVAELDWRLSGFVAVRPGAFPDDDPTAHRPVKWYNDAPLRTMAVPDRDVHIRPACTDPDPEIPGGYVEMTPLYAASRGAVWCHDPACYPEA